MLKRFRTNMNMPEENPLLGHKGEKTFNAIGFLWIAGALISAYLSNWLGVPEYIKIVVFQLFDYLPALKKYSEGTVWSESIEVVYLYCFFTWPLCLFLLIRYVNVEYPEKRILSFEKMFIFSLIIVFSLYLSLFGVNIGGNTPIGLFSKLFYYKLWFAAFAIAASFFVFTSLLYNLFQHGLAIKQKGE